MVGRGSQSASRSLTHLPFGCHSERIALQAEAANRLLPFARCQPHPGIRIGMSTSSNTRWRIDPLMTLLFVFLDAYSDLYSQVLMRGFGYARLIFSTGKAKGPRSSGPFCINAAPTNGRQQALTSAAIHSAL